MAGNVLSTDQDSDVIYLHSGFTSTISDSFSSPSTQPYGLFWDGTNVLSGDSGTPDKIYLHSGFTSTISDSFSSPSDLPVGIAWDGTNILSTDQNSDLIYLHSGFTSTISDSFSSPSTGPSGLGWDGTNVLSGDTASDLIYLHSGFTSTISSSFSSPSTTVRGVADDSWSGSAKAAALTGTITAGVNESDIVTGGKTLIITLTGDTWIAAGALDFDLQRDEIIAGVDSAQSEATGWDLVPKATQSVDGVVRTSDTVVTITWDAFATYNITAQETITVTVPATAVVGAQAIVATPTFTIATVAAAAAQATAYMTTNTGFWGA